MFHIKTQLHKTGHSGGLLGRLLGPLLKPSLRLMKTLLEPLPKSILIPLGLTTAASATDAAIHKKIFGYATRPSDLAEQTTIISNEEMNIMKTVEFLEESGLLIKGVSETIQIKVKEQKGRFLTVLLGK